MSFKIDRAINFLSKTQFGFVGIAMLASVGSLTGALFSAKQTNEVSALADSRDAIVKLLNADDFTLIRKQVAELQERSRRLEARPSSAPPVATDVADLASKIDAVAARQAKLENTLTDQPLKALEIPMLRRDLDSQSKEIASLTASLQRAQEAQWDTMKWVIGGLGAAIAAIFIPFVNRLLAGIQNSND
jgi:hypothetical protein